MSAAVQSGLASAAPAADSSSSSQPAASSDPQRNGYVATPNGSYLHGHAAIGAAHGPRLEPRRSLANSNGNGNGSGKGGGAARETAHHARNGQARPLGKAALKNGHAPAPEIAQRPLLGKRESSAASVATVTGTATSASPEPVRSHGSGKRGADDSAEDKKAKKRRKVNHACVYCRRSHMTCDQNRPCSRCIKRDIGHLCRDEPRDLKKPRSGSKVSGTDEADESVVSPKPKEVLESPVAALSANGASQARPDQLPMAAPPPPPPSATDPSNLVGSGRVMNNSDWNNAGHFKFQDIHNFHPQYMFNTTEVNNEYNLLNDFLSNSLLDDATLYQGEDPRLLFADGFGSAAAAAAATQAPLQGSKSQLAEGNSITRPASTVRIDQAQEKFYMFAADPTGTGSESSEERMNQLLKEKYDAGLLKPFNYVKGYARLNQFMERNLRPISRQKILRQLEMFRPKFRERMQSLTDVELVRVEMWFEMRLMEYDRVFASMAVPACCWRRTGEIVRGNREMAELIGVPLERLREGKLAIHDIIGEESLVMYWTKFGQIAFDASKRAMLASCNLKKLGHRSSGGQGSSNGTATGSTDETPTAKCCFSFTVQRDEHLIPSIIIGNFLEIPPEYAAAMAEAAAQAKSGGAETRTGTGASTSNPSDSRPGPSRARADPGAGPGRRQIAPVRSPVSTAGTGPAAAAAASSGSGSNVPGIRAPTPSKPP